LALNEENQQQRFCNKLMMASVHVHNINRNMYLFALKQSTVNTVNDVSYYMNRRSI